MSSLPRILVYIVRRDLRLDDNPVFHEISQLWEQAAKDGGTACRFSHVLPIYVFSAEQISVSGFLSSKAVPPPYPDARSEVGGFPRCGPHRAKFLAESVWDLDLRLRSWGEDRGLIYRVGTVKDVVEDVLDFYSAGDGAKGKVVAVWMTAEEGTEEKREQFGVETATEAYGIELKLWHNEAYFIDDRKLPFDDIDDLPNIFTTYRKSLEPLREQPLPCYPTPSSIPPLPPLIPPQKAPFMVPNKLPDLIIALLKPLDPTLGLSKPPRWPLKTQSAYPFAGGESAGHERLGHLISSGSMTAYKDTRNGLVGLDYSTKLSAYLAHGCLTARQVHAALVKFEDGTGPLGQQAEEYGQGENEGTAAVRYELLWRDYMRLCARKFGSRLFSIDGFQGAESLPPTTDSPAENTTPDGAVSPSEPPSSSSSSSNGKKKNNNNNSNNNNNNNNNKPTWKIMDSHEPCETPLAGDPATTSAPLMRFLSGTTGISLIDASQRELFLTGYTSNRARQNVASFLARHLGIDWRIGAEWYECLLIDYDVCNNWGNWQYVAGVGNDPREGRMYNPIKQALEYDPSGEYVKAWAPELRGIDIGLDENGKGDPEKIMCLFQPWKLDDEVKKELSLKGIESVERPLVRIPFSVGRGRSGSITNNTTNTTNNHNHNHNHHTGGGRGGRGRGWWNKGRTGGGGHSNRHSKKLGDPNKATKPDDSNETNGSD